MAYRAKCLPRRARQRRRCCSRWPLGEIGHHDVPPTSLRRTARPAAMPVRWNDQPLHAAVVHFGLAHRPGHGSMGAAPGRLPGGPRCRAATSCWWSPRRPSAGWGEEAGRADAGAGPATPARRRRHGAGLQPSVASAPVGFDGPASTHARPGLPLRPPVPRGTAMGALCRTTCRCAGAHTDLAIAAVSLSVADPCAPSADPSPGAAAFDRRRNRVRLLPGRRHAGSSGDLAGDRRRTPTWHLAGHLHLPRRLRPGAGPIAGRWASAPRHGDVADAGVLV